tara:strand:- start:2265 stop:3656 length:1392 start_codon:yes stop_codon:yes gene_type:complete
MKVNKQTIKKIFKNNSEKISKLFNNSIFSKKKINSKQNKKSSIRNKSNYLFNKISKLDKYQNIIEKFSKFNKEEIEQKKSKAKKISKKYQKLKVITSLKLFKSNINNLKIKNKFSNFYSYLVLRKQDYLNRLNKSKAFQLFNLKSLKKEKITNKKFDQKIGIIFYGDHNLIFISLILNLNNKVNIEGVTEIPIPGNVIGDSIVEDSNELANIALDSINLLDLDTSPLLVVLSSSFFNIHTFKASDLKQISQSDDKVQSKSPYLPVNTLVDFLRMSDPKISDSLIRTIYSKKDLINGWTDTLEIINLPVIGLIPAAPSIFDSITENVIEENTILIDIESSTTTVLIGSKLANLNSHKLPFGSSLYLSSNLEETSINYFDRVLNSINLILKDQEKKLPSDIFVMGSGLDKLINKKVNLPKGFKKISELNLTDFSYSPKSMKVHELVSNSIDSSIYSLSTILSSCV